MSQNLSWALFLWENIGPVFLVQGHEQFSLLRSAKGTYEFKGGEKIFRAYAGLSLP
jgi:hypothetical protein